MYAAPRVLLYTVALVLALAAPAAGQTVVPIGPFAGDHFEGFELGLPNGTSMQNLSIFGSTAVIANTTTGGELKFTNNSSLGGDLVLARTGLGMLGQIGIAEWTFTNNVTRFGGYWENNSRFDDAQVAFYDVNNNLLATLTATDPHLAQTWTWNGWESSVPIHRVVATGNDTGFLNGFIWFDDMQIRTATAGVPEPSTLILSGAAGCALLGCLWLKRRASRNSGVGR